jgi:hypothetical protein
VPDWERMYAEVLDLEPPARLGQRIAMIATRPPAAPSPGARLGRAAAWAIGGVVAAGALALLIVAAHSRHSGPAPATGGGGSTRVVANGVQLTLPPGWQRVQAASDAPVTDPLTQIVAGTRGVHPIHPHCNFAASYHLPATGAVVIVLRWASSTTGGGPLDQGMPALRQLTSIRPRNFECVSQRGAAVQLHVAGHDYQVNVLVGDGASDATVAQALAVGRSFVVVSPHGGEPTRRHVFHVGYGRTVLATARPGDKVRCPVTGGGVVPKPGGSVGGGVGVPPGSTGLSSSFTITTRSQGGAVVVCRKGG